MDCSHCGARLRHAARGPTWMSPESCPSSDDNGWATFGVPAEQSAGALGRPARLPVDTLGWP